MAAHSYVVADTETSRLAALHDYQLLDAPAGDELEAIVRIAAAVATVPFATLNLIDENRQCQLTTVGFAGQDSPRDASMCAAHFTAGKVVVTGDASTDHRFAANPWVDGRLGRVRFYASAPLVTVEGHSLGSLCVFDEQPGELTTAQVDRLRDLAAVVLALFERRRHARVQARLAAEAQEQREIATFALAELSERQNFTDALLETVDVGIVACGPDGRLTLFNQTARAWHGLDADHVVAPSELAGHYGLFGADGCTPLGAEEVPLRRALTEGTVANVEMVIAPKHRAAVRVIVSGRALFAKDGSLRGAVVAMRDVTEDRRRQRALEAACLTVEQREVELRSVNVELLRSNRELELFAAVAGHDLSAPLTAISGYAELLRDVYAEQHDDQARAWLETVLQSVRRMSLLITALLAYSTAGAAPCRRDSVDVRQVVEQATADLRATVQDTGAHIRTADDLPVVLGDGTLLLQLMQNLLANAIKYRSPDRPCTVTITASLEAAAWRISVTDNGRGIPDDSRERVFQAFERLDGSAGTGHGLGLATCQRIVHRHGGRIWVDQTSGLGTTLSFTVSR